MSFLDDLKKEAQQVKKAEDATRDAEALQRQAIIGAVRPRLRKVYDYFKDTCDQLTVVDPDIYMSYEVRGFGKLGPLRQGEYRVNAENPDTMDKFNVFFSCSRPDQVRFKLPGKETVAAQKEFMWSCNLRFNTKVDAHGNGTFTLEAYVPITIEFEADYQNVRVLVAIRNMDTLGTDRIVLEPDQLDDEFVDELAKCIVRKENHFQELTGNTVPKEVRMRLQQQLQHDRLKRDLEASSDRQSSVPKKKKKKGGLLRSLFKA